MSFSLPISFVLDNFLLVLILNPTKIVIASRPCFACTLSVYKNFWSDNNSLVSDHHTSYDEITDFQYNRKAIIFFTEIQELCGGFGGARPASQSGARGRGQKSSETQRIPQSHHGQVRVYIWTAIFLIIDWWYPYVYLPVSFRHIICRYMYIRDKNVRWSLWIQYLTEKYLIW